jgi:NAD(P)-dependent dehydrogenase (short-subunit alcohol dehydrogenase family)
MTYELTGLDGCVAIVTGAGRMRSIGRPIAIELARAGCDIIITGTGRSPENYPPGEHEAGWRDIASVAEEIEALGRRALPVVSNIADPGAVDDLVALAIKQFGRLDIVVNNAGAARGEDRKPVVDLDFDTWQNVLDVNLNGTFLLSRAAARHWLATETPGSIVNISSVGGKIAGPGTAAYSASKAAIHARQRHLPRRRRHQSPRRHRPWRTLEPTAQHHSHAPPRNRRGHRPHGRLPL